LADLMLPKEPYLTIIYPGQTTGIADHLADLLAGTWSSGFWWRLHHCRHLRVGTLQDVAHVDKTIANQIAHLLNPETSLPIFGDRVTEDGGLLNGKKYLTGDNIPASNLLLFKPSDVWVVGDSGVRVELSRDATIEADTAPTGEGAGPTAQSANMVSMFQTDMVAIRAIRDVAWQYRRAQAIVTARKTAVKYDGTASAALIPCSRLR
jgi:hypothetical protein